LAFIIFALGKPFYGKEKIERKKSTPEERRMKFVVLRRIFGLFVVVTFFWSIFDQSASTWTLFAKDHLVLELFGWELAPDQIQALNPVLIVAMLPVVTMFWHALARAGLELRPTDKMLIGFVVTAVTMSLMAIAGFLAGPEGRVSVMWEIVSYVLITVAEICISVVGLELAFTAAPPTMKSFVTACWLLTVFFGNLINAQITPLYDQTILGFHLSPGPYFLMFALVMVPVTLTFLVIARRFNRPVVEELEGTSA
jgi:POT family proton-dependent oligopeptide transporter